MNYGQKALIPFDIDEFYDINNILDILKNRLSEAIEHNTSKIVQYDIPQIIKDYTNTKVDSQLLQSLLDTNYTTKSNLTQNNKLGTIKQSAVIIDTTPIEVKNASVIIQTPAPEIVQPTIVTMGGVTNGGGSSGNSRYIQDYTAAGSNQIGSTGERVDKAFVQDAFK